MTNGTAGQEDFFDWDGTPDSNVLPTGNFHMAVESIEDGMSKSGKRMLNCRYSVVAPAEYAGMGYFENLVLGTEEAPLAAVKGAMGTRFFKQLCKASQVPPANSVAQLIANLVQAKAQFMLRVLFYTEPKGSEYEGQERNKTIKYVRLGELEPSVDPVAVKLGMAVVASPVLTPPIAVAVPPMLGTIPTAVPTTVAPPPIQPAPVAVAPVQPPLAPPIMAPSPVVPVVPAPVAPVPNVQSIPCAICGTIVALTDLQTHVGSAACQAAAAARTAA